MHFGPTPLKARRTSSSHGSEPPCSSTVAWGNCEDLPCLGLVERGRSDDVVKLRCGKRGDVRRRRRSLEKPARGRKRNLVAGSDRQHAGDELVKNAVVAFLSKFEHRRLWQALNRCGDSLHRDVNFEHCPRLLPYGRAARRSRAARCRSGATAASRAACSRRGPRRSRRC